MSDEEILEKLLKKLSTCDKYIYDIEDRQVNFFLCTSIKSSILAIELILERINR